MNSYLTRPAITIVSIGLTVAAIRTTNADTDYTADDNYVVSVTGSVVSYDNLSAVLAKVEAGDYWDESMTLVVAHPSLREKLRNVKDDQNRPISQQIEARIRQLWLGNRFQYDREVKDTADAGFAFDPDSAPHQFHELRGD